MRRRDEVMVEGLAHVLVDFFVSWVEDRRLILLEVPQEAIFGHALLLFCCKEKEEQNGESNASVDDSFLSLLILPAVSTS